MTFPPALRAALDEWIARLGPEAVKTGTECQPWAANCIGTRRRIPAVLLANSEEDAAAVVHVASKYGVALYPISTGRNWGYGSANPVTDDCVVLDLSGMDQIVDLDTELGTVTVQPGVTQQNLRDYLDTHDLPFLVPVTGAGPNCSVLGNALERGYGITPRTDHFGAVTTLRAILADGSVYEPALSAGGAERVDRVYKWGVGPYLDGLFSQGSFGVVTEMTIELARVPEDLWIFVFELASDADLEQVIPVVRHIKESGGGCVSGVNLMNRLRVLSMTQPYPEDRVERGCAIPSSVVESLGQEHGIAPWTGVGALYGDREVVKGLRRSVRKHLRGRCERLHFANRRRLGYLRRLLGFVPTGMAGNLRSRVSSAEALLDILSGRPREAALRLAYWRGDDPPADGRSLNPARDGCGLLWYAPLVPMTGDAARAYVDMVERVCPRFGIDPLVTLTTCGERCFDSTVPVLYPAGAERQGEECYKALLEEGRSLGILPYRLNVDSIQYFTGDTDAPCRAMAGRLKRALDPHDLIAPGRYIPRGEVGNGKQVT